MASVDKNFVVKNGIEVNAGQILLGGTGRIQGIDTVTDPTDAASKFYVDSIVPVTISDTEPLDPEIGDLWWDSDVGVLFVYYDDGTSIQWVEASPSNSPLIFNGTDTYSLAFNLQVDGTIFANGGDVILGGTGRIQGIDTVSDPTDAASKSYVDTAVSSSVITQEEIEDFVGGMVTGNTENGISVTYDDVGGKLDFDVDDFTITLGGDLTGNVTITNLSSATLTATIAPNSVALGTDTTGNYIATGATSGNGISGSASGEGSTFTVTSNATNVNTGSTIVFRDASGNFSAGTITASLNGNATTATTSTNATNVTTTADNATNASRFITFVNSATGSNQQISHDNGLTYNPSSGLLTSASFSGNGSALTNLNASNLASGTVPSARLSGTYNISITGNAATATTATTATSATTATNATNVTTVADNTTNATRYITFVNSATGSNQQVRHDNGLTYNPSTGQLDAVELNSTSDGNLKKNVETSKGLEVVTQLRGVEFEWKGLNQRKSSGVIAQEVEQVVPHVVSENLNGKSVNYQALSAYLIEAIKEQQKTIEQLQNRMTLLETSKGCCGCRN